MANVIVDRVRCGRDYCNNDEDECADNVHGRVKITREQFARWGFRTENARNRPTTNQIVDREVKEYDKMKNNIE